MRTRVLFLGATVVVLAMAGSLQAYGLAFTTTNWSASFPGDVLDDDPLVPDVDPLPDPGTDPHGGVYPGDSVAFTGQNGTFASGDTVQIGTITFDPDWTWAQSGADWLQFYYDFGIPTGLSIDGTAVAFSVPAQLQVTWFFDTLVVNPGSAQFTVGSNLVEIATQAINFPEAGEWEINNSWTYTAPVMATFTVTEIAPVPEPASMTILGLGILGLAGVRRLRKRA